MKEVQDCKVAPQVLLTGLFISLSAAWIRKQIKPASLGYGLGRREAFEDMVTKRRAKGMRTSIDFIYFLNPCWCTSVEGLGDGVATDVAVPGQLELSEAGR